MRHPVQLRQLRYFIAVAEESSFRRAAERLFITQPPLSRQIRALEEDLGAPLFDRDRQGVRLTEAGRRFLVDARALVRDAEQVVMRFDATDGSGRERLRLGITTVVDVSLFAWVEAAFEARHATARVEIRRQISARSVRDLQQGLIDVAVIGLPSRTDGLIVEPLCEDPMVVCLPANHRAARRRKVSIVDLGADRLFWFERRLNPAYYDYCEKVFERVGYAPQRLPEPLEHPVLLGLIAEGHGIALIPRSLDTIARKGVVYRPLVEGDALCIRVGVAWRLDGMTKPIAEMVSMLREHFAKPPRTVARGHRPV